MNQVQQKLQVVEDVMAALPQAEIPVETASSGGMHCRMIILRKGTLLTGAIHLSDHLNVVYGDITVASEEGLVRLIGAHIVTSKGGVKRIAQVHEDTMWATVLRTDETDPDAVMALMTATRFDDPRLPLAATTKLLGE